MEENINENKVNKEKYSNDSGTGVLSSIIFIIAAFALMFLISKYFVN